MKFSIKTLEEAQRVSALFKNLIRDEAWLTLVAIIQNDIDILGEMILTKVDPVSGERIDDAQAELCRIKRNYLIEVRDTPNRYIDALDEPPAEKPSDDPYFKSIEELIKSRRAR